MGPLKQQVILCVCFTEDAKICVQMKNARAVRGKRADRAELVVFTNLNMQICVDFVAVSFINVSFIDCVNSSSCAHGIIITQLYKSGYESRQI